LNIQRSVSEEVNEGGGFPILAAIVKAIPDIMSTGTLVVPHLAEFATFPSIPNDDRRPSSIIGRLAGSPDFQAAVAEVRSEEIARKVSRLLVHFDGDRILAEMRMELLSLEKARMDGLIGATPPPKAVGEGNNPLDTFQQALPRKDGSERSNEHDISYCFEITGDMWLICYRGKKTHISKSKFNGLMHIAKLLEKPDKSLTALEIEGDSGNLAEAVHTEQEIHDDIAMRKYENSIIELNCEIEKAKKDNDQSKIDILMKEKTELINFLAPTINLFKKSRPLGPSSFSKEARERVRKARDRAYKALEEEFGMTELVAYLKKHIKQEGISFAYRTEGDHLDWRIKY
jgi:hypothetical protein